MDISATQIVGKMPYNENLKTLYRILLDMFPDKNMVIWGAGRGYEIPEEKLDRILAIDIDERFVNSMRARGINALVGDLIKKL